MVNKMKLIQLLLTFDVKVLWAPLKERNNIKGVLAPDSHFRWVEVE